MVSAPDSESRGPGSSPGWVIVLCSWARHYSHSASLHQEYKWVLANCQGNLTKCWEVTCVGLASYPGGVAILLVASCYTESGISSGTYAIQACDLTPFFIFTITKIINFTFPIIEKRAFHDPFANPLPVSFEAQERRKSNVWRKV